MSIIIRDVDRDVYNNLKALAISRGLKVGQALEEAMQDWVAKQSGVVRNEEDIANDVAYQKLKPTLIRDHSGKWILIANGELQTVADSLTDLINAKKDLGLAGTRSLVFQAGRKPRKVHLSVKRVIR